MSDTRGTHNGKYGFKIQTFKTVQIRPNHAADKGVQQKLDVHEMIYDNNTKMCLDKTLLIVITLLTSFTTSRLQKVPTETIN